ncbi:MAG: fimbrillin family protein [Muribaculaceae bacterium]|nr:fimbrillin family protein [Muribaculaceae bacterium]
MKKFIRHIASVLPLLALLAACEESDVRMPAPSAADYIVFGRPEINLDATVGDFAGKPSSRATLATSVDEFTVWGYCVPDNVSGGGKNEAGALIDWNDKSKFFTNTTKNGGADLDNLANVTVRPSDNNYNFGQLTSWNTRTDALYSFIGAAGNATFSMERSSAATSGGHGPRLTVTLPTAGNAVTTPLVRADQPDVLVAAKFDHKKSNGTVVMSFMHIMTGLRFKFHNHSSKDLIIKSMTFRGQFHKQAVIDFTTDDPVITVPTGATNNRYSGTFTIIENTPSAWQTITHGSEDFAGGDTPAILLLLPNPDGTTDKDGKYVLGSNKSIDITYRFADDPADRADRTFTTPDDFVLNYLPQPNTLHTAHFNFIGDNFVLTFQADEVKNWENGSDNKFTIM